MKLIQIQYFLVIAECKSITKAAEQLFISQPALSKQMNLLEEELGVKLLKRLTSGIELTETGEQFAKDCKVVIRDLDKAVRNATNSGKKEMEVLRIGCFDGAVVEDFLPALYAYFRKKAPGLRIKLNRHDPSENRRSLEEDSIDMLIELRFPFDPEDPFMAGHDEKFLVRREGALIYSKNSPLAKKKKLKLKDFEKETFYLLSSAREKKLSETALETLRDAGLKNLETEEVDNFVTLLSNIRLGLGFSVLAKMAAETNPDLLAFDLPLDRGIDVFAVWKKENKFVGGLMKDYK